MENEPQPQVSETEPTEPDFTTERLQEVFPDIEMAVLDEVATLGRERGYTNGRRLSTHGPD